MLELTGDLRRSEDLTASQSAQMVPYFLCGDDVVVVHMRLRSSSHTLRHRSSQPSPFCGGYQPDLSPLLEGLLLAEVVDISRTGQPRNPSLDEAVDDLTREVS